MLRSRVNATHVSELFYSNDHCFTRPSLTSSVFLLSTLPCCSLWAWRLFILTSHFWRSFCACDMWLVSCDMWHVIQYSAVKLKYQSPIIHVCIGTKWLRFLQVQNLILEHWIYEAKGGYNQRYDSLKEWPLYRFHHSDVEQGAQWRWLLVTASDSAFPSISQPLMWFIKKHNLPLMFDTALVSFLTSGFTHWIHPFGSVKCDLWHTKLISCVPWSHCYNTYTSINPYILVKMGPPPPPPPLQAVVMVVLKLFLGSLTK